MWIHGFIVWYRLKLGCYSSTIIKLADLASLSEQQLDITRPLAQNSTHAQTNIHRYISKMKGVKKKSVSLLLNIRRSRERGQLCRNSGDRPGNPLKSPLWCS